MREDELSAKERLAWEQACVKRALGGDRRAFAELYREYAPRVFQRVLMPKLGNRMAAEDALSETFRVGLERLGQWDARGVSIYYWFARIASNKAIDMHRVKARTRRALSSFEQLLMPLTPSATSEDEVELADEIAALRERIDEVLDRLNPRYRQAIELRFFRDRSRQSCADVLEVKLGTFDVLVLRALRAFKREWERVVGAPPELREE